MGKITKIPYLIYDKPTKKPYWMRKFEKNPEIPVKEVRFINKKEPDSEAIISELNKSGGEFHQINNISFTHSIIMSPTGESGLKIYRSISPSSLNTSLNTSKFSPLESKYSTKNIDSYAASLRKTAPKDPFLNIDIDTKKSSMNKSFSIGTSILANKSKLNISQNKKPREDASKRYRLAIHNV